MKYTVIGLGVVSIGALLLVAGDDLARNHPGLVAGGLVALGFLFLAAAVSFGVYVGAKWTRGSMELGADIALKAQQTNDAWDARKTAAMAQFGRAMIGMAKEHQGTGLALPLPSQDFDQLLPPLTEYNVIEANESEE